MCWATGVGTVLLGLVVSTAAAENAINLELRPGGQAVGVGAPVAVGLYAVCDPGRTQLFRAADVVLTWEPAWLRLLGVDNAGATPLLVSTLPAGDPYGLNGPTPPPADGDAYYQAWAPLGAPVNVTDAGVLLTTLRFSALATTPGTLVDIADSGGDPLLQTRVFGSAEAGTIVTGTLGSAVVTIVPEPAGVLAALALSVLVRRR